MAPGVAFSRRFARSSLAVSAALALLSLPACKRQPPVPMFAAPAPMGVMSRMASAPGATAPRIAWTQGFVLELPGAAVQPTLRKHLADCLAAGCSVLNSRLARMPDGGVQGSISVRIAPDRYQAFADAITAPPARLISHTETAEDKTIPLLDIEKRLDAQVALRDHLTHLLQQPGGSVGDLVAVEKQLADIQGTIESETAQRNYLRTITDTVKVDVSYNGLIQEAGPFDISPVRTAIDRFARTVIGSLGDMINWIAYALPWLPLVMLASWIVLRLIRRRAP